VLTPAVHTATALAVCTTAGIRWGDQVPITGQDSSQEACSVITPAVHTAIVCPGTVVPDVIPEKHIYNRPISGLHLKATVRSKSIQGASQT